VLNLIGIVYLETIVNNVDVICAVNLIITMKRARVKLVNIPNPLTCQVQ